MLILVVEDEPLIAMAIETSLAQAGHDILGPVPSAVEALALAAKRPPDLALVNIELQHGDSGVQLARTLHERWGVRSIFTTGEIEAARRNRDIALGVICKPYSGEAIAASVAIVEAILRGERVDRSRASSNFELFLGSSAA